MPLSVPVVGTFVLPVSDAFDRSVAVGGFAEDEGDFAWGGRQASFFILANVWDIANAQNRCVQT